MADLQTSPGNARDLLAYARRIYVVAFPCKYWTLTITAASSRYAASSASCSSGQRFAFSFLRIPPRDGHPCRSANTSPCRVCRGLTPPSHRTGHHNQSSCAYAQRALPGAQQKNSPSARQRAVFNRDLARKKTDQSPSPSHAMWSMPRPLLRSPCRHSTALRTVSVIGK